MEPFLVAGRTSSSGHAHIPEARLDHRLGPAELMFRADVKEEAGNMERYPFHPPQCLTETDSSP